VYTAHFRTSAGTGTSRTVLECSRNELEIPPICPRMDVEREIWEIKMRASPDVRGRARATVITLLTDFGHRDPYVGIMKGVILGINPQARLVDLTHHIEPQAIPQAALALRTAWRHFPRGTVHLCVVDPGVGSGRAPVALSAGGHLFVGPDNGVFTSVLDRYPGGAVHRIEAEAYRLPDVSQTFHGRDIFAPAAAWLSLGVPISAMGAPLIAPVRLMFPAPRQEANDWYGEVLYIDTYGNLVTNLPATLIPDDRTWEVSLGGQSVPGHRTYSDVQSGALVAVVGSFECVEIACNGGSARERLGLGQGTPVRMVLSSLEDDRSPMVESLKVEMLSVPIR